VISEVFYWLALIAAVFGPPLVALTFNRLRRQGRPRRAAILAAVAVVAWLLGVWSVFIEPETLVVRQLTVASPLWSGPPVRLGLIADTHVGAPHMNAARMARIVARMNAEHPDLVLLLGDYVGGHDRVVIRSPGMNTDIMKGIAAFGALKAPLGVVGVLGNHDVWYNTGALRRAMQVAGVTVLESSATVIHRPGGDFWVAGLTDLDAMKPRLSLRLAYAAVPPDAPSILIAHEPDAFVIPNARYAFMAAGHTHCGQVNLPFVTGFAIGSYIERKLACHLHTRGDQFLYVSAGLGVSGLPMRFRAPPELDVITLTAAPGAKYSALQTPPN
jgi:predicted MPP superfamily phosphohydrolase